LFYLFGVQLKSVQITVVVDGIFDLLGKIDGPQESLKSHKNKSNSKPDKQQSEKPRIQVHSRTNNKKKNQESNSQPEKIQIRFLFTSGHKQ
jgi:hypothetical protein